MSDDTDDDGHTVGERILLARAETAESELATATTTMELAIRKLEAAEAERDRLKAHVARHREQMEDYERLEAARDEAKKWWEYWQHKGMTAEAERDRLAARVNFLELGDMTATAEAWEGEAKRLAARVTELEAAAIPVVNKLIEGSYGTTIARVTKAEINRLRAALDKETA